MDTTEIMEILPHRYPFLLIDWVEELTPGKRVVAIKNVTANEPHFQGHWPENPVMPGVLILEAMAQAGAILILTEDCNKNKQVFFAGADKVRWRQPVVPGHQLKITVVPTRSKGNIFKGRALAYTGEILAAEAEITCVISE